MLYSPGIHHPTEEGCRTPEAEILPTALIRALLFKSKQSMTLPYRMGHHLLPGLSKKRGLTKRLHAAADLLLRLCQQVGHVRKHLHLTHRYVLDSFALAVCPNSRIRRCKLLPGGGVFCAGFGQEGTGRRAEAVGG